MSCQDRQTNAAAILNIDFANQTCCEPLNLFFLEFRLGPTCFHNFVTIEMQSEMRRQRKKNFSSSILFLILKRKAVKSKTTSGNMFIGIDILQ